METKDLILLMLIPIILVSLVFYIDKSPAIIGAVTQDPKKDSNILGTYSINPSFKAKINYDLDDYAKIKDKLDFIIKCSHDGKDIETCIKEINEKETLLKWELNCDKGAEKVLYDFAEFLQGCFDSDDNNCLCAKNIENEKIQEYGLNGKYEIEINAAGNELELNMLKVNDEYSNLELSHKTNTKGISGWIPKQYIIAYANNKLFGLNLIFQELSGEIRSLGPLKEIIIYKNDNNPNKIKSIDFVRKEGDNLIYPVPGRVVQKQADLHPCQLKPKNIYKFCVTQNNYKVMAYDRQDGQVKERNPVVKLASYVPDLPPQPLKNLEAFDRIKAEKSILLKWDKSNEKDIAKFRIYYAESSDILEKTPTEELKKNQKVVVKEIDAKDSSEINVPLELSDCEFDYQNKKCLFSSTEIENEKLYFSTFFNAYIYSINVPEDKKAYDFSVTAVDKNNNEINNVDVNQNLPILKNVQSIDDLAPSSENIVVLRLQQIYEPISKKVTFNFGEKPKNSIDGTASTDFKDYKIYHFKYASLTQEEKVNEISKMLSSKLKNLKFLASVNYEQHGQPFLIDLSATNPEQNNVYLFAIIASDINGNPKEEQFKLKELGAQVLQLAIP